MHSTALLLICYYKSNNRNNPNQSKILYVIFVGRSEKNPRFVQILIVGGIIIQFGTLHEILLEKKRLEGEPNNYPGEGIFDDIFLQDVFIWWLKFA